MTLFICLSGYNPGVGVKSAVGSSPLTHRSSSRVTTARTSLWLFVFPNSSGEAGNVPAALGGVAPELALEELRAGFLHKM